MTHEKYTCDCGCMGFGPALSDLLGHVGPTAARDHFRAARVEFLKGIRAVLDARIDHLSKKQAETTGTTIPVE
jgi:hypothetical protein